MIRLALGAMVGVAIVLLGIGHIAEGQEHPLPAKMQYSVRVQGLASDGKAPPPPTATPTPVPPTPAPTATPDAPVYGACPLLISQALGWAGCAISYCESHWDQYATGRAGERGWFQIHPAYHPDATWDPAGNVAAAIRISSGGANWGAWSVRSVLQTGVCPNGVGRLPF